ncbi:hypothetical protein BgiBS90_014461, partial [Biomphalaria glabrata]
MTIRIILVWSHLPCGQKQPNKCYPALAGNKARQLTSTNVLYCALPISEDKSDPGPPAALRSVEYL